jgi:hypothetical protein
MEQFHLAARTQKAHRLRVGCLVRLRGVNRINAIRDDMQARGRNDRMCEQIITRGLAVARDHRRLAQAAQDAPRHRSEPPRAPLAPRLEEAPKRIQVVARDNRAIAWKCVDELAVAVIDDMIQIERTSPTKGARVVPEAIHEAVGVMGHAWPSRITMEGFWPPLREAMSKRRADSGGVKLITVT